MKNPQRASVRTRDTLLQAAFQEIYRHGFQGASLDRILEATAVTKGALYHHFNGKRALGYAVFDEVVAPFIRDRWLPPLAGAEDPIAALKLLLHTIAHLEDDAPRILFGCPLNNLVQEMSPLDTGFRARSRALLDEWRSGIEEALQRGQRSGIVRADVEPADAALLIAATVEGCYGIAKAEQSAAPIHTGFAMLGLFLDSLRA